ncbi:hypothetical protein CHS0354_031273 [Potamilus streckersoni]|uniref:TIR domain-containing protein n=1 Tax=Potamilus streckersoni TaxID=2493646 RepID=A0AAE0SBR6_9BIVA|nr:hypothetical protein CHS0354_031273 [Potamilus streckersoni]
METSPQKLFRLDSQVSVDAAPDGLRGYHKGLGMQETSLMSNDVSVDALPRNDHAPLQIRTCPSDSSLRLESAQSMIQHSSQFSSGSASSDTLIHQGYDLLTKSVQDKIQSYINSKNESSFEESSSFSISESFCSRDDDSWLKLLAEYEKHMPPDIKIGYFDVMVLYCEDNQNKAREFCEHLRRDIKLKSGESVKAVLYDCEELTSLAVSKLRHLEKALERCTYVFIYMTKEFCEDTWMELSSEECLMKAIYDEEKRWCVVPVYTVSRRNANFKIPMGLNSLKGINYYNNDQFYQSGVSRLIEDKLYQRLKNEKKHQDKQYEWLQGFIRKLVTEKENRKRLEHMEKLRTDQHILEEQRRTDELLNRNLNQQHPINDSEKYYPAMHYSYSEPGLQNMFYSSPHSASSGCIVQVNAKGQPCFVGNVNPNSFDTKDAYNVAYFQRGMIDNANIMGNVDPYTRMQTSAVNENPPPYSSQMSSLPQYSDVMAAGQIHPSKQGQIQSLWCNQQVWTHPVQFSQQAPNQMYQQNPDFLPSSIQQMHNQMSYTQFAMTPQQTQNGLCFAEQQILNQSGIGVQQLDHIETQNTGFRTDLNMQQTVNQAAVSTSALYLQGDNPIGIPLQNTVGQRENYNEGNDHPSMEPRSCGNGSHPSMEPRSCGNETPLNNSPLSADQLSQLGSTHEMEPTAEEALQFLPVLSVLGQNSLSSLSASSYTEADKSNQEGGVLPDFNALSLRPSMDGRSLTSIESGDSQSTSASQSQGSKNIPVNLSEENASSSTPTPDNTGTDMVESDTETIRKTKGDGEKVIIHHHYHYYEKEKDEPKIINIYDAKTVQIGDSPTVIESKKLQNKSKNSKELPIQKEKTNTKFQSTLHDVVHKEIDNAESQTPGISELKVEHASVANQHISRESEDCLSVASRTSRELKQSLSKKKDEEKEEQPLRTESKDHNNAVMEEKKDEQISSIPKMEKKNEPIYLGTKSKIKPKPIATVPPSPSGVQIPPFKKAIDSDNEETVLKTVGREQSDDTRLKSVNDSRARTVPETVLKTVPESGARNVHETVLKTVPESGARNVHETVLKTVPESGARNVHETVLKTVHESGAKNVHETVLKSVHESGARNVHETQTKTEETSLKLSAPQRATNTASQFRGGSQTDKSQYQAPMQQITPNRASSNREGSQIDLGLYQPTMRPGPLFARAYNLAAVQMASSSQSGEMFADRHVTSDLPSQDELDEDTLPDGGPPNSEGFVPNTQLEKEEWYYLDTDSFDAREVDPSNSRRRKKANSSSTDNKSCTVS